MTIYFRTRCETSNVSTFFLQRNPSPSAASVCNSWLADRKSHTINFVNREVVFNCNFKTVKDGPTVSSEVVNQ